MKIAGFYLSSLTVPVPRGNFARFLPASRPTKKVIPCLMAENDFSGRSGGIRTPQGSLTSYARRSP